jgi:CRISPR-associated protein Cas1
MEFRNIFMSKPGRVSVFNNQLAIEQEHNSVSIPIEDISSLLIETEQVSISSYALTKLSESGVTVFFCDSKHLPSCQLLPLNQFVRQRKMLLLQFGLGKPVQKQLWQSIVRRKINNQAECLDISGKDGGDRLREIAKNVTSGDAENAEAAAASFYFPKLFGTGFSRGRECYINAALNYGYAIIRGAVARNLVIHGLEPCLGLHHRSELNNFNLADDIMEPFRPIVDLYAAGQDWDEEELNQRHKQSLFNLTNFLVKQDGNKYRVMSAIGRCAVSLAQSIKEGKNLLELPELIPLELHRYE